MEAAQNRPKTRSTNKKSKMRFLLLVTIISAASMRSTAFVVRSTSRIRTSSAAAHTARTILFAAPPSPAPSSANFEYQEMRIILAAMQQQGISDLASPGKGDLEQYVRSVARSTPTTSASFATTLHSPNQLLGTTWRLAYSNDLRSLPPDATVFLQFQSERDMVYQLKFGPRTLGLDALSADCLWQLLPNSEGTTSTSASQLTFVYDKIKMDAFGLKSIGTGLFGMLQGRSQTIHTAYFDGDYWIDLGNPLEGDSSVTAYVKVEDLDTWRT